MKTEWHAFAALMGISFVIGMLAASHISAEYLLSAIVVLLFSLLILLWRALKLLYGLADKLGYRPARTERLNVLLKKLHPSNPSSTSKLTDAQREKIQEEFDELAENDSNNDPPNFYQLSLILGHLQNITALLAPKDQPSAES